jgi:hypothetical protein
VVAFDVTGFGAAWSPWRKKRAQASSAIDRQSCCRSFVDDRLDRPGAPPAFRAATQMTVYLGHARRNVGRIPRNCEDVLITQDIARANDHDSKVSPDPTVRVYSPPRRRSKVSPRDCSIFLDSVSFATHCDFGGNNKHRPSRLVFVTNFVYRAFELRVIVSRHNHPFSTCGLTCVRAQNSTAPVAKADT